MTKREIAYQLETEGIDPCEVSLSAVSAYRVAYFEKSGHTMGFMEAVREMYKVESDEEEEVNYQKGELRCAM